MSVKKTKMLALNTLRIADNSGVRGDKGKGTPGKPPVMREIVRDATFMADEKLRAELLKAGAAADYEASDAEVKQAEIDAADAADAADAPKTTKTTKTTKATVPPQMPSA